jgi:hypothetical protein
MEYRDNPQKYFFGWMKEIVSSCKVYPDLKEKMEMQKEQIFPLARQTMQAIYPRIEPNIEEFADRLDIDRRVVGLLTTAITFDPQPISAPLLHQRSPYTNASFFLQGLEYARDHHLLEEIKPGEFILSAEACRLTLDLLAKIRQLFSAADPLPERDSKRLGLLLNKLAKATVEHPPSPEHVSARRSYAIMPPPVPPLPYIEQAISCMGAYRDDSHLAAWQPTGISATAIEALTFLWRGDADSLDTLCDKLPFRNHPKETYAAALDELRKLGYIEGSDDAPSVTAKGKSFREKVEQDTDELFFKPWSALTQAEIDEIGELLTRMQAGFQARQ